MEVKAAILHFLLRKRDSEWFLDLVYYVFLATCAFLLVFGFILLLFKRDSIVFYVLFGFIAYLAGIYMVVRSYKTLKALKS